MVNGIYKIYHLGEQNTLLAEFAVRDGQSKVLWAEPKSGDQFDYLNGPVTNQMTLALRRLAHSGYYTVRREAQ